MARPKKNVSDDTAVVIENEVGTIQVEPEASEIIDQTVVDAAESQILKEEHSEPVDSSIFATKEELKYTISELSKVVGRQSHIILSLMERVEKLENNGLPADQRPLNNRKVVSPTRV